MKLAKIMNSSVVALAIAGAPAFADGDIRGGVTAVSIVANSVAAQTPHNGFRWGRESTEAAPLVNTQTTEAHSGVRWAEALDSSDNGESVVSKGTQSGSKWIIRSDAGQSGSKWIIRSDAGQSGSKWIIRSDADQSGSKWIIR